MDNDRDPAPRLRVEWTDDCVLQVEGVLDASTYHAIRDAVVKCALDEPPMVVIEVTALEAPAASAWSVFTSARWLTSRWPEVPMALVCQHVAGRKALAQQGISRYVPLYGTVDAATSALGERVLPPRRRARERWTNGPEAVAAAQRFVSHWLRRWSREELIITASVIATVLVDNVIRHTTADPDVRLEAWGETVTVAVSDSSASLATVHEDASGSRFTELQIVHALSRVWGNTPLADGKVVWAVIGPENEL